MTRKRCRLCGEIELIPRRLSRCRNCDPEAFWWHFRLYVVIAAVSALCVASLAAAFAACPK